MMVLDPGMEFLVPFDRPVAKKFGCFILFVILDGTGETFSVVLISFASGVIESPPPLY